MFNDDSLYQNILFLSLGSSIKIQKSKPIASGKVNKDIFLETSEGKFFLKLNTHHSTDIFEKEANGLNLLAKNSAIQIPIVYATGVVENQNFLLLEWIDQGKQNAKYWSALGEGLAQLHHSYSDRFGLEEDNYIASLIQENSQKYSWSDFFISNRLNPLIQKAFRRKLISHDFLLKFERAFEKLSRVFPEEKPSLVHGDLWSGNVLTGKSGFPVLIDPAVYYGHREMDLAFSHLFGGFDDAFYKSYHQNYPLEPGFNSRIPIYNLYPLLVHLHLFGRSYLPTIGHTIHRLLG